MAHGTHGQKAKEQGTGITTNSVRTHKIQRPFSTGHRLCDPTRVRALAKKGVAMGARVMAEAKLPVGASRLPPPRAAAGVAVTELASTVLEADPSSPSRAPPMAAPRRCAVPLEERKAPIMAGIGANRKAGVAGTRPCCIGASRAKRITRALSLARGRATPKGLKDPAAA